MTISYQVAVILIGGVSTPINTTWNNNIWVNTKLLNTATNFFISIFNSLRRPKLQSKVWIKLYEINKYFKIVMWITCIQCYESELELLKVRIKRLIKRSGWQFTFLYLKEVNRLMIRSLCGSPEPIYSKGIIVSRDSHGLPRLIPLNLRKLFLNWEDNQHVIRSILTFTSIYRIFPTKVAPSLSSIIDPFVGLWQTLDVAAPCKELFRGFKLKLKSPQLIKLETAGPNAVKSAWGSSLDALAFIEYPDMLLHISKYLMQNKGFLYLLWILALILIAGPLYIVFRLVRIPTISKRIITDPSEIKPFIAITPMKYAEITWPIIEDYGIRKYIFPVKGKYISLRVTLYTFYWKLSYTKYSVKFNKSVINKLELGKLGVVRDQAGKARIVGITNYWVQLALKPLHSSLFSLLRQIETDGTFDQHKPLDKLLTCQEINAGHKFHCFDLTAATDRIPIKLQIDILNTLSPNLGTLWGNLLNIKWYYKDQYVSYSVGQPMGAYSSWAMLAVSHHIIVRYCALQLGIKNFSSYALLGDDIVICHDDVASLYLQTMQNLGVTINLSKSIVSTKFAEFAKVWRGPNVELTPLGPGLILRSIRYKDYIGVLVSEAYKASFIKSLSQLLTLVRGLTNPFLSLWSTVGVGSEVWKNQHDAQAICWGIHSVRDPRLFLYCLFDAVKQHLIDEQKDSVLKLEEEKRFFYNNWWKIYSSTKWPSRVLEALLKLFGPGFWIYAFSFERTHEELLSDRKVHTYGLKDLGSIRDLVALDSVLSVASIDWREREKVKSYSRKAERIAMLFERTLSDMEGLEEMI